MASVVLTTPDVSLFSDPAGTRLEIPHLSGQQVTRTGSVQLVQFHGEDRPRIRKSRQKPRTWSLEAVYGRHQHQAAVNLEGLFSDALEATDSRLQLRTMGGKVEGLDPLQVVSVPEWTVTRTEGVVTVSFSAHEVEWAVGVGE